MSTTKKQIRDRVAAIIAETHPGLKIFSGHFFAVSEDELPFAAVYFQDGTLDQQTLSTGVHLAGSLDIDVYATQGDDALDAIADPLMPAILLDAELRDITLLVQHEGYQYQRFEGQTYGAVKLLFTVNYVAM